MFRQKGALSDFDLPFRCSGREGGVVIVFEDREEENNTVIERRRWAV